MTKTTETRAEQRDWRWELFHLLLFALTLPIWIVAGIAEAASTAYERRMFGGKP